MLLTNTYGLQYSPETMLFCVTQALEQLAVQVFSKRLVIVVDMYSVLRTPCGMC